MWPLPGPLSEKPNFKFVIYSKTDFSGGQKRKNCILTLNFIFSGQLGSIITLRHAFRSSWNFQKLIQVTCTSDLSTFQIVNIFFPRSGGSKNCKQTTHVEHYFQFLMLNISTIKELLHKPSEIQWNIIGTLPGKLKRKLSWALC